MKANRSYYPIILAFAVLWGNLHCFAAQFTNLNFEAAAATTGSIPIGDRVPASIATPGWSAFIEEEPSLVLFSGTTYGSSAIALLKAGNPLIPAVLSGQFSIDVISGFSPDGTGGYLPTSASISQTGIIPSEAFSLRFIARGSEPQVFAGGTLVPVFLLGTTPTYALYGADISPFAGSEIELKFHRPHTANFTAFALDDITFSTEPVPEPSVLALFTLTGAALLWNSRRHVS